MTNILTKKRLYLNNIKCTINELKLYINHLPSKSKTIMGMYFGLENTLEKPLEELEKDYSFSNIAVATNSTKEEVEQITKEYIKVLQNSHPKFTNLDKADFKIEEFVYSVKNEEEIYVSQMDDTIFLIENYIENYNLKEIYINKLYLLLNQANIRINPNRYSQKRERELISIYQKNKDEKLAPASMTKMMSMLLIMEEIENGNLKWNEMITTSEKASSMGGSQIFLKVGEKMTVEDLLKGVAIASGNDAVVALAERVSGSEEQFVKRMNIRAKDLGLKNTNFINATGLTADNHYSSAYDMSLIAKELVKHEKILEFTSTYEDYLRKDTKSPFWLVNTNRLVRFKEGVDGLKTGFTDEAGYCLTATMKKDNMRLITVVMKEENTSKRSADTTKMLDYGFNIYMVQTILDEKTTIEKKKVELGKTLTTEIVPKENITILNKKSDDQKNITYKTNINKIIAPVKKGDKVGTIDIIEDNNIISTIDATVKEDISKANILTIYLRNIKEIISGNLKI